MHDGTYLDLCQSANGIMLQVPKSEHLKTKQGKGWVGVDTLCVFVRYCIFKFIFSPYPY